MKEFKIGNRQEGQRLDKYLAKVLPRASKSFLYKMLRKKNIVLNDKKAAGNEILKNGDLVRFWLSDDTFDKFAARIGAGQQTGAANEAGKMAGSKAAQNPDDSKAAQKPNAGKACTGFVNRSVMPGKLPVIYEDENILIVNKPAGILSQKAEPSDYSMNEWILDYLLESGTLTQEDLLDFRPSICNRLDRNTSGLLIAGKTVRGLQEMGRLLADRSLKKYYRCLVVGKLDKEMHLSGYLCKDTKTNKVTVLKKPAKDARPIETSYLPIRQIGRYTLLEVHLITGRSHQIRAHLASVGHPILGDPKYGSRKENQLCRRQDQICRQLLHAYRMVLPDGREFTAPLPEDFERILRQDQDGH